MKLKNKILAGALAVTLPLSVMTPAYAQEDTTTNTTNKEGSAKAGSSKGEKGEPKDGSASKLGSSDKKGDKDGDGTDTDKDKKAGSASKIGSSGKDGDGNGKSGSSFKAEGQVKDKKTAALECATEKEWKFTVDGQEITSLAELPTAEGYEYKLDWDTFTVWKISTSDATDKSEVTVTVADKDGAEVSKDDVKNCIAEKGKVKVNSNSSDNENLKKYGIIAAVLLALGGLFYAFTNGMFAAFLPGVPAPAPAPAPADPEVDVDVNVEAPAPEAPVKGIEKGIAK